MTDNSIYTTIKERCGGNIYIGVVGPVRTGKSTFIRRFMDSVVIPNIENEYDRERTQDEIPQSGSGKTITTTEPKFIPSDAVKIKLGEAELSARMIDCVGYMIDGAVGAYEDGAERMVMTPWSDEAMPFSVAGEMGTKKVVREHSTIAMLVTTDGSICDIPRECYISAEQRVAEELKAYGVPFAIILNSANPNTKTAHELAQSLEEKYGAPVALVNCATLNDDDARGILSLVVGEFPVRELSFELPEWCSVLPEGHRLIGEIKEKIASFASGIRRICDVDRVCERFTDISKLSFDAGCGCGKFELPLSESVYYDMIAELTGIEVSCSRDLLQAMVELSDAKRDYDKIRLALLDARERGYGIVMPTPDELTLSEPQMVKQGAGYGIRVSASADSYHIIKTGIRTDVCPVVGTEEQSEEVIKNLSVEYEEDPKRLLESKMFGRSLSDLVSDGMNAKLTHIPDESRAKLSQTLEKIMNEGANGLICILL